MRRFLTTLCALALAACSSSHSQVSFDHDAVVFQPLTLSYQGPELSESRQTFTNYRLDVTFSHPDGDIMTVPGYFAASERARYDGAERGDIWQAKFVPTKPGQWSYKVRFTQGPNVAISTSTLETSAGYFDGDRGTFKVTPGTLDPHASDFAKRGMLLDVKGRYLQFSGTKDYFLKTGAGSPENILAYEDFDGTYDVGGTNFPALGKNQLHGFEPHLKDAREGDPIWNEGRGAAILGIANYYEEVGVNAQYLVTMNIEGDGQDVFPYVSHSDPYVFDVSKLAQWQTVFEHFNRRGVMIDMLLAETENESWFEAMDGVDVGKDFADSRKLYYREMVARFGHLNGLVWNLGEEHGVTGNSGNELFRQPTTAEQRRRFAAFIRDLDPYDRAVMSHNWPDGEEETYGPLLGDPDFSGISLQAHHSYFKKAQEWTTKSADSGRGWMVTIDEPLGWEYGARPDAVDPIHGREIKGVLWPALMGGSAGVDWYFGWQNNAPTSDLSNEDQRSRHNLWVESADIRRFFERQFDLPSLTAKSEKDGQILVMTGLDKLGHPIILTAARVKPALPEGEGHLPWEYDLTSLTLQHEGVDFSIDPMAPVADLHP